MNPPKPARLNTKDLTILAINNLNAALIAAQVDEALLNSMLITITDNDQALTIQAQLTQTQDSISVLTHKLKILENNYGSQSSKD